MEGGNSDGGEGDLRRKVAALVDVARFDPLLTGTILVLSIGAALLEGVGLSFILPILEIARSDPSTASQAGGYVGAFYQFFQLTGIPFTLEYIVLTLSAVLTVRFSTSFCVAWLRAKLRTRYERHLKTESFQKALNAKVSYFDTQGSDEILNSIVTEAQYAARVIHHLVRILEESLLSLTYLVLALYLAPVLSILTVLILGSITYLVRFVVNPAYAVGSRLASANEEVQKTVQAGTQGIRDVKLFNMEKELFNDFSDSIGKFERAKIGFRRNQAAITNVYRLISALTIFGLLYAAISFTSMSLGALGLFLFAMFRLSPKVSNLNHVFYKAEGDLPHLVRIQNFIDELHAYEEPNNGSNDVIETVKEISFESVSFAYDEDELVLDDVSFKVEKGEFIAFAGQSGAGKSTIIDLLTRMYEPDSGTVRANGSPIVEFDIDKWRSELAVLRQDPYMFNDSLRYNVTIGNRDASEEELTRACEIAQVTEFVNDLPNGFDTMIGDRGVRLSGGQRQRVALARALLMDAEVLVLDEATSNLDTNIEEQVQSAINSMDREYIVIAIAHRLSTIKDADRIYTVESGQLTDIGTHEELLGENGKYSELYAAQSGSPP